MLRPLPTVVRTHREQYKEIISDVFEHEPPPWSSGQSSRLLNGDVLYFL
jgi:hypothetical protein